MREFMMDGVLIGNDSFVASKIEIREGSSDKDTVSDGDGRVVLLAQNGMKYRVYSIAANLPRSRSEEDEEDVEMSQEVQP